MKEIIVFILNGKEYGVEIGGMQSLEKIQEMSPVPDAPDYILGSVTIRDQIYPVFDINNRLGLSRSTGSGANPMSGEGEQYTKILLLRTPAGSIACLVDGVGKVLRAEGDNVQSFPKMAMTEGTDFVDFIVREGSRLIVVIKPDLLLSKEQIECIRKIDFSKTDKEESEETS